MADKRKRSFFPSIDSRFTGALEPSPNTGSYYNPARYANQGFSRPELSRIQSNLSNVYNQDLQYNRVANPQYQTTQDTGYSSTAPFGSGRASAATTQQYALKYGTPTGNGLSTFQTPSGGSITYRPSGRTLPGGMQPGSGPFSDILGPLDRQKAYAQGYGEQPSTIQQGPGGQYKVGGGVAAPYNQPNIFQQLDSGISGGLKGIGTLARNIQSYLPNVPGFPNTGQPSEANQATNFGTPGNFGLAPGISAPAGINSLVPPPPLTGRPPNEQMFPTGAGGSTFFPSAQPGLGTVQMGNERFPGNMPLGQNTQYPTPVSQPPNQALQMVQNYQQTGSFFPQSQPRRYFDY